MNSKIRRLLLMWFVAVLISIPVVLVARSNEHKLLNAGSQDVQRTPAQTKPHKERILPPYGFSETTPPGNWSAIAEFDVSQTNDPYVPVVIVGLASYAGKGQWAKHLMVVVGPGMSF